MSDESDLHEVCIRLDAIKKAIVDDQELDKDDLMFLLERTEMSIGNQMIGDGLKKYVLQSVYDLGQKHARINEPIPFVVTYSELESGLDALKKD